MEICVKYIRKRNDLEDYFCFTKMGETSKELKQVTHKGLNIKTIT